jgi:hypothetical protein
MRELEKPDWTLAGPPIHPAFARALNEMVATARQGQPKDSQFFNPSEEWLVGHMRIFQDLPTEEREQVLQEARQIAMEAEEANAVGKAATRAGPDVAVRLDSGGLGFFSQLGVARRPDLTQYFIDGFFQNRDGVAFSEASQALFAEILPYMTVAMKKHFIAGDTVVQTDRQLGDASWCSFHARQLLFGTRYPQIPYMWRQLTFDLPEAKLQEAPQILEVSLPNWLEDLGMPEHLKDRIREAGLTQLVFKAPTRGLSMHLGFDYVGEHKMGPLSIAMFLVKQAKGLALQAALSMARVKTLDGKMTKTALVTTGPSLHGKSTLTIMLELSGSEMGGLLGLEEDPGEAVYPMNDDILLLHPLPEDAKGGRGNGRNGITYGIGGTEGNFYAVPFRLTHEDDPITYDVLRGASGTPNHHETLENVPVNLEDGAPDFNENPVRNMRMVLSRTRLLARKGVRDVLSTITDGRVRDAVHVPMHDTDRVFWQGVMRLNTIIPPLIRLTSEQYVRSLMYGEAVRTGAAVGAIGVPYVEYFSDPFIIGLEDEHANLLYTILKKLEQDGVRQEFYMFNTGGVGADSNAEASGRRYKKIPRELTLMLQEALLRGAAKFEHDPVLGADVAVAIVNQRGEEVIDLRKEWLPRDIYGDSEYREHVLGAMRRRYYSGPDGEGAGVLRYTKVTEEAFDLSHIPVPSNERELAWLLSFYWHVDQAYNSLPELARHLDEGNPPGDSLLRALQQMYRDGMTQGLELPNESLGTLQALGIGGQ